MKKFKCLIAALIIFSLLVAITGCTLIDERAVGTVSGESVSIGEYNFFLNSVKREMLSQSGISEENAKDFWASSEIDGKKASEVAKEKAFEQVVLFEVKTLKAIESGLAITDADKTSINQQYTSTVSSMGGSSAFETTLKNMGLAISDYKKILEKDFIIQKYFTALSQDEKSEVFVTDQEVVNYYSQHSGEKEYKEKVTAKHILFKTVDDSRQPLSQEEIEAAKVKADETYAKIQGGADFDTLMKELSQDPGLAQNPDGYTFGTGEMVPEFENAAFSMAVNEISQPVKSDLGYHIIKVTNIQSVAFDTIKDSLKSKIQSEKFDKLAESWKSSFPTTTNDKIINSISL